MIVMHVNKLVEGAKAIGVFVTSKRKQALVLKRELRKKCRNYKMKVKSKIHESYRPPTSRLNKREKLTHFSMSVER